MREKTLKTFGKNKFIMKKGKRVYNFGLIDDVFDIVVDESAKTFECTPSQLKSKSRVATIVAARHMAIHALWNNTNATKSTLARKFNKNHASIIHAIKSIDNRIEFFGEKGEINIDTSLEKFNSDFKISGSSSDSIYRDYLSVIKKFNNQKLDLIQLSFNLTKTELDDSLIKVQNQIKSLDKRQYLYNLN